VCAVRRCDRENYRVKQLRFSGFIVRFSVNSLSSILEVRSKRSSQEVITDHDEGKPAFCPAAVILLTRSTCCEATYAIIVRAGAETSYLECLVVSSSTTTRTSSVGLGWANQRRDRGRCETFERGRVQKCAGGGWRRCLLQASCPSGISGVWAVWESGGDGENLIVTESCI